LKQAQKQGQIQTQTQAQVLNCALLFVISFLISATSSQLWARSPRILWVPVAAAGHDQDCRLQMEQHFTPEKHPGDSPGVFSESAFGFDCRFLRVKSISLDGGLDWRESGSRVTDHFGEPLQGHLRAAYGPGQDGANGWAVALGVDDLGFNSGQNNFNVISLVGQFAAEGWTAVLGAYSGNPNLLVKGSGEPDNDGALLGIWHRTGWATYGIEHFSGKNHFGYSVLGGLIQLNQSTALGVGYGIANNRETMRDLVLLKMTFQDRNKE
jgi:hypothetical protein